MTTQQPLSERNNKDWLRVSALLTGEKEQYAIVLDGVRATILLKHDRIRDSFQVVVFTEFLDGTYNLDVKGYGRDISGARRHFARLHRQYTNQKNPNRLEMKENQ